MLAPPPSDCLLLSDRVVDLVRGEVRLSDGVHPLTQRELALLSYLARRAEQVVSRDALLADVWQHPADSLSRAVDLAVRRLRTKLEAEPHQPRHLLTVFGEGYQLVGVQRALPASNVPGELDRLFGRDALLAELAGALEGGCRALALVGPFGVGKTRLATRLGLALQGRYRGGAWWCDLSGCDGLDQAKAAVARALRLPEDALEDGLAHRPATLLLLDELDALPEAVDTLVARWLRTAPGLAMVLTARRPIRVPGLRLVEVPPLSTEAAVALLVDRAAAAGQDLSRELEPCRRLVERLDQQPLAIELAAVQTRLLSLPALIDRLGPAIYRGGRLEQVLHSAYAGLSPEAQRVLGALACFAGGFQAEAVEVVAGASALPALQELLDHSLVLARADQTPSRLRLLESVQQFALARDREAGRDRAAAQAHVRWAAGLGLAEAIEQGGRSEAWARLEAERDNLLVAWRRAEGATRRALVRELGPILAELPGSLTMLDEALEQAADDAERGALLALRGRTRRLRAHLSLAQADLALALKLLPAHSLEARACTLTLALLQIDRGEVDAALPALGQLASAEPPDAVAGSAAVHRGRVLRGMGQLASARAAALEGIDILQALGARRLQATALGILSDMFDDRSDRLARALECHREAARIHKEEGNLRGEAVNLTNMVNTLADLERWEEVWAVAEQARAAHQALGARRSEGILLSNLCGVALSCWELDRAEALGRQAVRICAANGVAFFEGQSLLNLGIGELARRRYPEAQRLLLQARAVFAAVDHALMGELVEGGLAVAEAAQDRIDAAQARFDAIDASGLLADRPALHATLSLQRGFLDLARARAGLAPPGLAQERIDALYTDEALRPLLSGTEVRGMIRLLREAIAADYSRSP